MNAVETIVANASAGACFAVVARAICTAVTTRLAGSVEKVWCTFVTQISAESKVTIASAVTGRAVDALACIARRTQSAHEWRGTVAKCSTQTIVTKFTRCVVGANTDETGHTRRLRRFACARVETGILARI